MSSIIPLSRLEPAGIRTAWPDESRNFTPWLADNLDLLGDALGLELELEGTEVTVGPFSADILARDVADRRRVLIENQCTQTDHRHLGQIVTYAAGLEVSIVVWVVESFREEHRAAIDFLNRVTNEDMAFFGVEVRLFRVGETHVPQLDVVAKPNSWIRAANESRRAVEVKPEVLAWQAYWNDILGGLEATFPGLRDRKRSGAGWQSIQKLATVDDFYATLWVQLTSGGKLKAIVDFYGPAARLVLDRVRSRLSGADVVDGLPLEWLHAESRKGTQVFVTMPGVQSRSDEGQRPAQIAWLSRVLPALRDRVLPVIMELQNSGVQPLDTGRDA